MHHSKKHKKVRPTFYNVIHETLDEYDFEVTRFGEQCSLDIAYMDRYNWWLEYDFFGPGCGGPCCAPDAYEKDEINQINFAIRDGKLSPEIELEVGSFYQVDIMETVVNFGCLRFKGNEEDGVCEIPGINFDSEIVELEPEHVVMFLGHVDLDLHTRINLPTVDDGKRRYNQFLFGDKVVIVDDFIKRKLKKVI